MLTLHQYYMPKGEMEQMKKFHTITLAVALTTALSFGAVGAHAHTAGTTTSGVTGTTGTLGTGTTTTSGYTGSNYDATVGIGTTPAPTVTPTTVTPAVTPNTYSRGTDGVRGQINTYGNNMMDRMSTTGTNTGRYDTTSYRTYATTPATTRNMNWGWLGLLGLIGLAGLRGNNKRKER
jgi:hypothetical protein